MKINLELQQTCPVCGGTEVNEGEKIYAFRHGNYELNYAYCESCDCYWLVQRLSESDTEQYYKNVYRNITRPQEALNRSLWVENQRAKIQLKFLAPLIKNTPQKILDIGCSSGKMLNQLRELYPDATVEGVDLDVNSPANYSTITEALIIGGTYDLIICSHTLEHINRPLIFASNLDLLLNKGGLILIDVPNANVDTQAFLIHHPVAYTENSLRYLMSTCDRTTTLLAQKRYNWDDSPIKRSLIQVYKFGEKLNLIYQEENYNE